VTRNPVDGTVPAAPRSAGAENPPAPPRGHADRPTPALLYPVILCGGGGTRLWPATEWLKAALLLAEQSLDADRPVLIADADALRALWLYLTPDGLWRDKRPRDGRFVARVRAHSTSTASSGLRSAGGAGRPAEVDGLASLDLR